MDEQIPTPEPASSGLSNPPPPPLLRPVAPPVIPASPGLIKPPPTPPKGGSGWKVLSFLLMGLIVLWVLSRVMVHGVAGIATRGHTTAYLNRNLEEVVLEHTNSANKIAVVEISGVISGGEVDRADMDSGQLHQGAIQGGGKRPGRQGCDPESQFSRRGSDGVG